MDIQNLCVISYKLPLLGNFVKIKAISIAVAIAICSASALHAVNIEAVTENALRAPNFTASYVKELTDKHKI